ncbi:hypothetical protein PY093_02865 [Cytobacillus sp. S13-E01]|uniref:hypothetical protein n=1 Tax=Cytobacillus sp. S13-E01 TaxID=3031326 RepID=UPI0023D88DFC|nr:hypothetical protein [Cytobacillus sp. S13-E01]MDF0725655.1 hypothetical protein [Cytobacillus sp. S13-E01]
MDKKVYWAIIFITIAINVVMLQWTVEAYHGQEYSHVYRYTIIAVISALIAFITFLFWRKKEYSK